MYLYVFSYFCTVFVLQYKRSLCSVKWLGYKREVIVKFYDVEPVNVV